MDLESKGASADVIGDIRSFETLLKTHLELEDKIIYPFFAKQDFVELRGLGRSFAAEMARVTKVVLKLFNKYEKKDFASKKVAMGFVRELSRIKGILTRRVTLEETILFPAYKKYSK
ncbi:MAG: hemerythrin domain-containing protein [Nanoarchaeota archaeon]